MKVTDLKPDDYYYGEYYDIEGWCIVKGSPAIGDRPNIYIRESSYCKYTANNRCAVDKNIRLATLEEIHWLECCINKNEFVSMITAIESFIKDEPINYQQDSNYNNILIKLLTQ